MSKTFPDNNWPHLKNDKEIQKVLDKDDEEFDEDRYWDEDDVYDYGPGLGGTGHGDDSMSDADPGL